jgi:8-oxo-dGTP diphosphatase
MLNRNKAPLCGVWHGVGGKLEANETPYKSVLREVYEETGLVLTHARFAGVVTWSVDEQTIDGMYVYIAGLPDEEGVAALETPIDTEEGILAWKLIDWITSPDNEGVPKHVRHFLKPMLESEECWDYRCVFREGRLLSCEPSPLDAMYVQDVEPVNAG